MPKVAVKCPICGKVKLVRGKGRSFLCCSALWPIEAYKVAETAGRPPKEVKEPKEAEGKVKEYSIKELEEELERLKKEGWIR